MSLNTRKLSNHIKYVIISVNLGFIGAVEPHLNRFSPPKMFSVLHNA